MEIAVPVAETEPPSTDDRSEAPGTRDGGARSRTGPGEQKDDAELQRETLVLLFASREPLTLVRLVELLERPATARVQAVLEKLRAELDASPFPLVLRNIA